MKHFSILLLVFLFVNSSTYSQKLDRAISAYNEAKYEKALELFRDLVNKDASVLSIVGYVKTFEILAQDFNMPTTPELYRLLFDYLNFAIQNFSKMSYEEKAQLTDYLKVSTISGVNSIRGDLSLLYWKNHIAKSSDISEVETFREKYMYAALLDDLSTNLLAELYFEKSIATNSLESYKEYLSRFSQSKYSDEIKRIIESMEFDITIKSNDTYSLEKFIDRYPRTRYRDTIEFVLSNLYFNEISDKNDREIVEKINLKFKKLKSTPLRNSLIDSCLLYLFYIDKSEIEENTDLNKLNSFIRKYQSFKLQNISTIIDKRNTIWKDQLTKSESIDYKDAKDFILTTKSTEQMVDEILNRMNAEISNTIYSSLVDFIKEKIQSQFSFGEQKKTDDLTSFLLKQIDLSVKISNGRIYQLLKVTKKLSSSEIWEDIARQIGLNELVQMKTIYVKSFGESNNFIEVLQLDNLGVAKKVYFEFSVNGLIPLSDVKTNYPIYNAIKTRYQISTFSIPQFRSKNDRGYEVLLYGYATGNMPCCPTYEIKMLYAKNINSLEPITAISVNSNYNTIETSTNLTQYFKLDKQIFTTE